eukprot:gnl/Spiro4/18167_TR9700_c0_g1_i1.p1 gnl/Spiro4/18167_TR9700_c0_g1~~gnl/Spiro4/18167_TR9700_c0_g1_i1.p1  ORF type:complete len:444 (+),score=97.84 gnl/Spiro4/18167_TR9700_c0_g1_i1:158-1333(+)
MIVTVDERMAQVSVIKPGDGEDAIPKTFSFDVTFGERSLQRDVYDRTARPVIESVMTGYNGTIFAYGQTGTGKTHTMEGVAGDPEHQGIIPNAFQHMFQTIGMTSEKRYLVYVSYLEIYNEEIRDLMVTLPRGVKETPKLQLKQHPDKGVYVKDLTAHVCKDAASVERLLADGKHNRHVGETLMNAESSRSHSVFTITCEIEETYPDGKQHVRVGKLNLVDLAGSERLAKTGATGIRQQEAAKINLSLSALGNVISALVQPQLGHIPYRDSKLTRLLQDSLGGNTKTVMCATISPADSNYDETISTLRYADRAKQIQNKAKINEDPKDTMLREMAEEIERLKAMLNGTALPGQIPAGGHMTGPNGTLFVNEEYESKIRALQEQEQRVQQQL